MTNGQTLTLAQEDNLLGSFLKDRRTKLDPVRLGYTATRRRTPGLRREEVAQRADVSTTWYTWLEQGRGGPPSAEVLDRLARALELSDVEREHLFLLAQNRPPEVEYRNTQSVTPQLQRVLDAFEYSPAYVKTPEWNIIAWNRAAEVVMSELMALPAAKRNLLRMVFDPRSIAKMPQWENVARFVLATFRMEMARSGAPAQLRAFVDEMSAASPEFARMWMDHDVLTHGAGTKHFEHPTFGTLTLEFSTFAIEGSPNLRLVVYNPATDEDREGVRRFMQISAQAR